jgi:hypothetical protein
MLERLLKHGCSNEGESWILDAVLASPWCWPVDPELSLLALQRRPAGPDPVMVGETCVVSVHGSGAVLWRLVPAVSGHPVDAATLVGSAAETADLAWLLAARDLPKLGTFRPLETRRTWHARALAKHGDQGGSRFLDGRSFGLALFLASASALLERALPGDLIALGELSLAGEVRPVGGLSLKLEALAAWVAGVTRVIVAPEQESEARSKLDALGSGISVLGVKYLSDAAKIAFQGLDDETFDGWQDEASASETLESLFRQVLDRRSMVLGWRSIASTAASLQRRFAHDGEALERARFVESIARRHEGMGFAPLPWPSDGWLLTCPRPIRLRVVAHVLQSATDGFEPELVSWADRALALVEPDPMERHAGDLDLLGAVGRALAAAGEHGRAVEVLRQAVDGWMSIQRPEASSFALSELLRVLGVLRRSDEIDAALSTWVSRFEVDPSADVQSRAFVAFAAGRALILCDRWAEGLERITDGRARWDLAPPHLVRSRLRWQARALAAMHRHEEAAAKRALLTPGPPAASEDEYPLLARLDVALEDPMCDPRPLLQELIVHPQGREVARIVGEAPLDRSAAHLVADRWRY